MKNVKQGSYFTEERDFPDAPHFIAGKPSNLIAKTDNIMAWFRRYAEENED